MKNTEHKGLFSIILFGLFVFILLFLRFGLPILRKEIYPVDFSIYYASWKAFLLNGNMYNSPIAEGVVLKYAPFFAIIFSPLALLTFQSAFAVWSLINSLLFVISLSAFYFIKFKGVNTAHFIALAILGLIFIYRSLMPEMKIGNVNLIVLGLFFLFLFFYLKEKIVLSALIFTTLAYIKMGPLIILLYFLRKRRLGFMLWFILFTLILVIIPPFLITLSFKQAFLIFKDWYNNLIAPLPQDIIHLQSLKFMLSRYLTNSDIYKINFLSLSNNIFSIIYKTSCIALILGALFYKSIPKKNMVNNNTSKELALIDINMLFILSVILSPACSYQNFIYLLAPLLVLFLIGWGHRERYPRFFWFSLAIMMLLGTFTLNSVWKMIGIDNVQGYFTFLVFTIWPIISLSLYFLLYSLRSRILKVKD